MRVSRKMSATVVGTPTFIIQVSDALSAAPNLWPAMNTQLRTPSATLGKLAHRLAVEQVAGDAFDAMRLERGACLRVAEARHADHALARRRALGHARQRRPHLAADADDDEVAVHARQVGHQTRRRLAHEVFQRLDVLEALRQRAHDAMPSKRSRPSASARILASAIERLSIQKPQSGWM